MSDDDKKDDELLSKLTPGELLKLKRGGKVDGLKLGDTLFSEALMKYDDKRIAARLAWPALKERTQLEKANRALKKSAVHAYLRRELVNEKKVLPKMARVLDEALDATKLTKLGAQPDHSARMEAFDRARDLLALEVPDEEEAVDVSGYNSAELEWIVEHGGALPSAEQREAINAVEAELVEATDELPEAPELPDEIPPK